MKMMFKRRYFLLLAALVCCFGALLFFFFHEGRALLPEEEPAARYNIQVIFKALANPPDFWRVVEQGVQSAAAEYGVNCEVTAPPMEKDVDRQIELVREAIARHPDAIILAASDYERMAPVCREVTDAGILLVTVDSDVHYDGRRCFVGTDNAAMGRKLAELVDEAVPPGEKIGVMGHVEGARTAVERRDGLLENVTGGPDRVAALDYCDGSEILSRQRTKEMLLAHPEIRCMVGLNESSALGVANAIRDLGLEGEVGLIACDSSEKQIQFMEQGTIQAFVIQNPFNMGYLSVSNTVSILQGGTVPEVVNTDSVIIKKEDLYKKENQKLMFPFTSVE